MTYPQKYTSSKRGGRKRELPPMPTNSQLNARVEQLEQRLNELGDLQPSIQRLNEIVSTEAEIKRQSEDALTVTATAQTRASELLTSTEESKKVVDELNTKAEEISKTAEKSGELLLERLGIANAEALARSFGDQASELRESSKNWWKSLKIWTFILVVVILGVVAWEAETTSNFGSAGFILKLAVVSPIAFLAYSASKQHRTETNLRHQYSFKAAVANSLESYRQLLLDNIAEDKEGDKIQESQDAVNRFLEQRIAAVFREPVENLIRVEEDDASDSLIIGYQGRIYRSLRRMFSQSNKSSSK